MSVLIRGMKMPSHCTECDFWHDGVFEHCLLNMEVQNEDVPFNEGEYPIGCPLVEVPPHGDLIDRDALIKDGWLNLHKEVMRMGGYAIHELPLKNPSIPVIIPAEEGET